MVKVVECSKSKASNQPGHGNSDQHMHEFDEIDFTLENSCDSHDEDLEELISDDERVETRVNVEMRERKNDKKKTKHGLADDQAQHRCDLRDTIKSIATICFLFIASMIIWSNFRTDNNEPGSSFSPYSSVEATQGQPDLYYAGVNLNLRDTDLITALQNLTRKQDVLSRKQVLRAFADIDHTDMCGPDGIMDIYSGRCWRSGIDLCGSQAASRAGECYNREHIWPKSWWGGGASPAETDLFDVYPVDGFVNARRQSFALGLVAAEPEYATKAGARIGLCAADNGPGAPAACFEPPDAAKGNLARAYFYMSVRYHGELGGGAAAAAAAAGAVDGSAIRPWLEAVLRCARAPS